VPVEDADELAWAISCHPPRRNLRAHTVGDRMDTRLGGRVATKLSYRHQNQGFPRQGYSHPALGNHYLTGLVRERARGRCESAVNCPVDSLYSSNRRLA
jgi:hypothetical protein